MGVRTWLWCDNADAADGASLEWHDCLSKAQLGFRGLRYAVEPGGWAAIALAECAALPPPCPSQLGSCLGLHRLSICRP